MPLILPRNLPRETRDTLFLLGVIAWVVLPHAQNLPAWCSAMALAVLLWRAWLALAQKPLPTLPWRVLLVAAGLAGTVYSHQTLWGRDAGVTLVTLMLTLKTLELRARRDAFVVFFLGFFALLTHFFYSQSLLIALAMLVGLWGLLAALVNAHLPAGKPALLQPIKTAGWLMLLGAPIMALLFVLFPRMAPLWGLPSDAGMGKTGLSETMRVGSVASLAMDDTVALRLKFAGAPPPKEEMYFRGPVLSAFDGQVWRPAEGAGRGSEPASNGSALAAGVVPQGVAYRYEVTLEPTQKPWLMALEAVTQLPQLPQQRVWQQADLQLVLRRPVTDLLRYQVESHTRFAYDVALPAAELQRMMALPAGSNPRTQAWAQALRQQAQQGSGQAWPQALSQLLLAHLFKNGYRYTLEPGVFGLQTADEFWFEKQAGFCEHIASSYVIAMRAAGVPARVVTGFAGAELNPLNGYWTVRNSDAHAWAEIWLEGQGWQRVDPTAAIAPWRVGQSQRLTVQPGVLGAAVQAVVSPTLVQQLRKAWDATNNAWNQWVLNYSQTRQLDVLKNLGLKNPSWQDLVQILGLLLLLAGGVGAALQLWQRQKMDPWLRLLQAARTRIGKAGVLTAQDATPRQLAAALETHYAHDPNAAERERWRAWLLALEALRYSPAPRRAQASSRAAHAALRQQLQALPALPKRQNPPTATTHALS